MIARVVGPLYNPTTMAANETALATIGSVLAPLGYSLSTEQPHISGERAHLSVMKMVLMGTDAEGQQVVIKVSNQPQGIKEIQQEKTARDALARLSFAQDELLQAKECFSGMVGGYYFLITAYISQDIIFVARSLEEQFFLALRAFEAQEAFHATTYDHLNEIKRVFDMYTPATYLSTFETYVAQIQNAYADQKLWSTLERAGSFLKEHVVVLERYNGYLTHTDFVPHNMRLHNRSVYALDLSSVRFGNKYEGWARFLNYMTVHNPELEQGLVRYLKDNRPDEYIAVRLMRVYKIGFLLAYYTNLFQKTTGNFKELTELRIQVWSTILACVLDDISLPVEVLTAYKERRALLRTEEEKERQREFAHA